MIPLRDRNPTTIKPYVMYAILASNVAVFLYQLALERSPSPHALELFQLRFGVVPAWLTSGTAGSLVTPLTSQFLHGGWMHIIGNMWFLWVFGDNVEDEMGHGRFVVFYLLCGVTAALAQVAIDPGSRIPMIGASGAIAGVLGGYVALHPRAPVLTLVPIFVFLQLVEIPAFFFIFIWFGLQLLQGLGSLSHVGQEMGGVAFFAHIGGFLAGVALVHLFRKKRNATGGFRTPRRPRVQDRFDPWERY